MSRNRAVTAVDTSSLRPFVIERPRILACFEDAARFPITIVTGESGTGKSVAVRQHVARLSGEAVYFDDSIAFDDQLVELDRAYSDTAQKLTIVVEHADRHLRSHSAQNALAKSVLQFPARRWLLICRDAAGLPLGSWISGRIASEPVEASDLRFTFDEAMAAARERGTSRDSVRDVFDASEGVPAIFTALCESPKTAAPRLKRPAPRELYAQTVAAMWERLDTPLQELTAKLSLLPSIAHVETQLTGAQRSRLSGLASVGTILGHDAAGHLQLHEPAAAHVRERIAQMPHPHADALIVGAATLLAQARRYAAIGGLLERCKDASLVTVFLSKYGFDIIDQGYAGAIAPLLSDLISAIGNHPVVLTLVALCESHAGRDDTAESWFFSAREAARGSSSEPVVAYRHALEMLRRGHVDHAHKIEGYATDESVAPQLRASIEGVLAIAHVLEKNVDAAREAIGRAMRLVERGNDHEARVRTQQSAAWVAFFTGDLPTARSYAPIAAADAIKLGLYDVAARSLSVEYNIAYDLDDDPVRSQAILEKIYSCGVRSRRSQLVVYALLGQVDLAGERGDAAAIARLEATLNAWEFDYSDSLCSESLIPAKALMAAGSAAYKTAYDLLTSTGDRLQEEDRRLLRFSEIAVYAAACGLVPEARAALASVENDRAIVAPGSRRAVWARANETLARAMLGETVLDLARELDGVHAGLSKRAGAYVAAVVAIIERWNGAQNHEEIAAAVRTLDTEGLGGYAAMLSALPAHYKEVAGW